jgi:hypothetical protein
MAIICWLCVAQNTTALLIGFAAVFGSNSMANPKNEVMLAATVNINFDGIQAVCFGNPNQVTSGVLNVPHHLPKMTINSIKENQTTTLAVLDKVQMKGDIYIGLAGVNKSAVSRYYGSSMEDPYDFRWNIDMESDIFQKQLHLREDKLACKVHFNAGLFYADNFSERPVRFIANDDASKILPINRRIAGPAAKINLAEGDSLVIKSAYFNLVLTAKEGVRYEINIDNLPPADMASMDHWRYYYDAISDKVTPYMPLMAHPAAFSPAPLVCRPAVFTKSQLN